MHFFIVQDWLNDKYYLCKGITEVQETIEKLKKEENYDYSIKMITEIKHIEDDNNNLKI